MLKLMLSLWICWQSPLGWGAESVEIDHIDQSTLYFKTSQPNAGQPNSGPTSAVPKSMKVDFYEPVLIGAIHPSTPGLPYFILTGKSCLNCPNDRAIYIVRPTANSVILPPTSYVYPGKILDRKTRALSVESRAFYGHCLPRLGEVFVQFQKEQVDRRRGLQGSVLIAEPGEQHLDERLIERHLPGIDPTLRLVRAKSCHEIEGKNRISVPVSLGKPSEKLPTEERDDEADDDSDDAETPAAAAAVPAPPGGSAPVPTPQPSGNPVVSPSPGAGPGPGPVSASPVPH